MRRHFAALLLLPLLVGGCSLLPFQTDSPRPAMDVGERAQRADQLRGEARMLRYSGRYVEALVRLNEAAALQPDDPDLAAERTQTERTWQQLREQLQDRIRATEATERIERLPLLELLVRADPADTELQEQLLVLRHNLQRSAEDLSACGRRQAEVARDLARRCLRLALTVRDDLDDQALLVKLERSVQPRQKKRKPRVSPAPSNEPAPAPAKSAEALSAAENPSALPLPELIKAWKIQPAPAESTEALSATEEQSPMPQPELIQAWKLMQAGNHFGAIQYLGNLQKNGLDTDESRRLLAQAEAMLAENTRALLEAGDLLYRQGMVKQALALWDAALNADPYNPDAQRRSERAARVLSNLEALGEEKAPAVSP